jgi:hypothetical protein
MQEAEGGSQDEDLVLIVAMPEVIREGQPLWSVGYLLFCKKLGALAVWWGASFSEVRASLSGEGVTEALTSLFPRHLT